MVGTSRLPHHYGRKKRKSTAPEVIEEVTSPKQLTTISTFLEGLGSPQSLSTSPAPTPKGDSGRFSKNLSVARFIPFIFKVIDLPWDSCFTTIEK